MNILADIIGAFWWGPAGFLPSPVSLAASHGLTGNWNVTMAVTGLKEEDPLNVFELAGGKIIGDLRMVATAGNVAIGGLQSLFSCSDPDNHYLLNRRRVRLSKYRRGTAVLLGAANSDNYYHWMVDSVPRWKMVLAANQLNYDFVLLHPKPSRFQEEVLDRLNVPTAKRLRCSKYFVHQFERLVVPAKRPHETDAWVCSYLQSLFPEKSPGPEKVYLRRGAVKRRLVNESELEAALAAAGFVSFEPGRLTVSEQAKLLGSARWIVAPHGAALTNLIFAPAGARVLELTHPEHKNECFPNIAATCGHHYAGVEGRLAGGANDSMQEYIVDVSGVLRALERND